MEPAGGRVLLGTQASDLWLDELELNGERRQGLGGSWWIEKLLLASALLNLTGFRDGARNLVRRDLG